jgi:epoxyqueuosine reductase
MEPGRSDSLPAEGRPRHRPTSDEIRALALEAGAAGCGVTDMAGFDEVAADLHQRAADGLNAGMAFTYRDPAVATDPTATFPWAQRLVAVAWPYLPDAGSPGPGSWRSGRIARFATEDHYQGL